MQWDKPNCPKCGRPADSSLEVTPSAAGLEWHYRNAEWHAEWPGTGDLFDTETLVDARGRHTLCCRRCDVMWKARPIPAQPLSDDMQAVADMRDELVRLHACIFRDRIGTEDLERIQAVLKRVDACSLFNVGEVER